MVHKSNEHESERVIDASRDEREVGVILPTFKCTVNYFPYTQIDLAA